MKDQYNSAAGLENNLLSYISCWKKVKILLSMGLIRLLFLELILARLLLIIMIGISIGSLRTILGRLLGGIWLGLSL